MDSHTQGLEQRTELQAHLIGQLMAPFRGMVDATLQRALEMRETLCRAPEPHLLADVIASLLASVAGITWHANFYRHPVARLERGRGSDRGSYGCHNARGFMA